MYKRNKSFLSVLLAGGSLLMASCAPLHPDLPLNYNDAIITVKDANGQDITVYMNTYKQLYEGIGDISAFAVNRILDTIASKLSLGEVKDHLHDNQVMKLYSSQVGDEGTSLDLEYVTGMSDDGTNFTTSDLTYANLSNELRARAEKAMLDKVNVDSSSFDGDASIAHKYLFNEKKFVRSLEGDTLLKINADNVIGNLDKVVNKTAAFAQVFTPNIYESYMTKFAYWTPVENKLTAQYIYNERYSNIPNATARHLSIVALKDPDNASGAASKLINAYKTTYLSTGTTIDPDYATDPLGELSLLWKGIGGYASKTIDGSLGEVPTRYENFLTQPQKDFLNTNTLANLYDGVQDDISHIDLDNPASSDKTLEDEYTEKHTISLKDGRLKKLDSLVKQDVLTEGIYRKTDLSSVPDKVKDRIFVTNPEEVLSPEGTFGTHRFITSPDNTGVANDIDIYDSASQTHYVVMMDNDGIYNSKYLGSKENNEGDETKRAAAMDVAYQMVDSATYRTDATVYWIKKFVGDGKFEVNNKSFYDYLLKNYPDLFNDDVKY